MTLRTEEDMVYFKTFDLYLAFCKQRNLDALDWLALLTTHIPNRGEQMVRYCGYYSNKSRGMRKKQGKDDAVPSLIESDISPSAFRKDWARLIQKIYNVDPLVCPKCRGRMRVISFRPLTITPAPLLQ